MRILFILFMLLPSTLFAGHGSSGGGKAREEAFKGIGLRLISFSQQKSITGVEEPSTLLDEIPTEDLTVAINNIQLIFLTSKDGPREWGAGRFAWTGAKLQDKQDQRSDLDALYVDEENSILINQANWDALADRDRYLLVRKEYWRSFSKTQAPRMRDFIILFFTQIENLKQTNSRSEIASDGLEPFKIFEGYYNWRSSNDHDPGYYVSVDVDQGILRVYRDVPYWFNIMSDKVINANPMFSGSLFGSGNNGQEQTLWVAGPTKLIAKKNSDPNFFLTIDFYVDSEGMHHLVMTEAGSSPDESIKKADRAKRNEVNLQAVDEAIVNIKNYEHFLYPAAGSLGTLADLCQGAEIYDRHALGICQKDKPKPTKQSLDLMAENAIKQLERARIYCAFGRSHPDKLLTDDSNSTR